MAASPTTKSQSLVALDSANAAIAHRAAVVRDLKAGRRTATELVLDPGPLEERWRISKVLPCVPGVGPKNVLSIMTEMRFTALTTLGRLTMRQRLQLAELLRRAEGAALRQDPDGGIWQMEVRSSRACVLVSADGRHRRTAPYRRWLSWPIVEGGTDRG